MKIKSFLIFAILIVLAVFLDGEALARRSGGGSRSSGRSSYRGSSSGGRRTTTTTRTTIRRAGGGSFYGSRVSGFGPSFYLNYHPVGWVSGSPYYDTRYMYYYDGTYMYQEQRPMNPILVGAIVGCVCIIICIALMV